MHNVVGTFFAVDLFAILPIFWGAWWKLRRTFAHNVKDYSAKQRSELTDTVYTYAGLLWGSLFPVLLLIGVLGTTFLGWTS